MRFCFQTLKKTRRNANKGYLSLFFVLFTDFREIGIPNASSLGKGKVSLECKATVMRGLGKAAHFFLRHKDWVALTRNAKNQACSLVMTISMG